MSTGPLGAFFAPLLATGALAALPFTTAAQEAPQPVRNDVAQAGREFLVLRHQKLVKGSHQRFYELSRKGVWPLFEKIGTRVVGQWQVTYPEGGGPEDYDEGYRLARYRSYNHWQATRHAQDLAGNGPDLLASRKALEARNQLRLDSNGPIFLLGSTASGGPYYFPGLQESYEPIQDAVGLANGAPLPVRHGQAKPGQEVVTMRYFKIKKGTFEEFNRLSRDGVWPFFEKMGARVIGQWLVLHPPVGEAGSRARSAQPSPGSPEYDEAYMLVRYASYDHWQATRPAVMAQLGGNGPDYELCQESLDRRRQLTLETSVLFLQGFLYHSPPVYLPALDENYRLIEAVRH